jgi:hypothetical protein
MLRYCRQDSCKRFGARFANRAFPRIAGFAGAAFAEWRKRQIECQNPINSPRPETQCAPNERGVLVSLTENPKMRGLLILPCVALLACAYTPRPPQPYTTYFPEMGHRKAVAWSDGTIILLHPTHFVLTGVVNVEPNYALKLRAGPGTRFNVVAAIPADATGILAFDKDTVWDGGTLWYPVQWQSFRGYVSGDYLPHPQ